MKKVLSAIIVLAMCVSLITAMPMNVSAETAADGAMLDQPYWEVENTAKNGYTVGGHNWEMNAPEIADGKMYLTAYDSVMLMLSEVPNIGDFSTSSTYTIEFDATATETVTDANTLYVAPGGWWNNIEIRGNQVRTGDAWTNVTSLNQDWHYTIEIANTTITSTITDSNGAIVSTGYRTNAEYAKFWNYCLRCQNGAITVDNVKVSKDGVVLLNDTFDYAVAEDVYFLDKDYWEVENTAKNGYTTNSTYWEMNPPEVADGKMYLTPYDSVMIMLSKVPNIGDFSTSSTYTIEFDAVATETATDVRTLYVAPAGWWNNVEVMGNKVRTGDTWTNVTSLNQDWHYKIEIANTTITTTIIDSNGAIISTGYRTNAEYAKFWNYCLRCENGAMTVDNVKVSKDGVTLMTEGFSVDTPAESPEDTSPAPEFDKYETTILACTDFQNQNGSEEGAQTVTNIIDEIENDGLLGADAFFCCGDYGNDYNNTEAQLEILKSTVVDFVPDDNSHIYVQGNHDAEIGTQGLAQSGNNDPESGEYGVFVINEDDYMWYNGNLKRIRETATNLASYLNEKLAAGYDKPIFVLSHLPLYKSLRTTNDGDAQHANQLFHVLNQAGAQGLNIIFMSGHDHSSGYESYLGGSAVYLAKGDSINIPQGSRTAFSEETLNFTYMNAGYVGYYAAASGRDSTLNMSLVCIDEDTDTVDVYRYDENGLHNLKSAGVLRSAEVAAGEYEPDTRVYTSPQTITLTTVNSEYDNVEILPEDQLPEITVTRNESYIVFPAETVVTEGKWTGSFDFMTDVADGSNVAWRNTFMNGINGQGGTKVTGAWVYTEGTSDLHVKAGEWDGSYQGALTKGTWYTCKVTIDYDDTTSGSNARWYIYERDTETQLYEYWTNITTSIDRLLIQDEKNAGKCYIENVEVSVEAQDGPAEYQEQEFTFDDGNVAGWSGGVLSNGAYQIQESGAVTYEFDKITSGSLETSVDLQFSTIATTGSTTVRFALTGDDGIDTTPRAGYYLYSYSDGTIKFRDMIGWAYSDAYTYSADNVYTFKTKINLDECAYEISVSCGDTVLARKAGTDESLIDGISKLIVFDHSSSTTVLIDNFKLIKKGTPEAKPEIAYTFTEDFSESLANVGSDSVSGWEFSSQSGPVEYEDDTVQIIGLNGKTTLNYYGSKGTTGSFVGQVDICFDEGYNGATLPTESVALADIKFGNGNNENARGAYFKYNADSDSITVLCQPEWGYNFYTGLSFGKWYTVRVDANLDIDLAVVSIIDSDSGEVIAEHETNFTDSASFAYLQGLYDNVTMIDNFVFSCDPDPAYEDVLHGYAPVDGVSHQNSTMRAYMQDSYDSIENHAKGDRVRDYAVPVTFNWDDAGENAEYTLELSENKDMTDAKCFETGKNYYDVYNLKLGTTYYWRVIGGTSEEISSFTTSSVAPRIMYASGVKNFRDIGGRTTTDGKTVSQGLVYRSYNYDNISEEGIATMVNDLGIKTEIDIRSESSKTESVLGSDVNFYLYGMNPAGDLITPNSRLIRRIFNKFADKSNYPINFHCQIGTDRTGAIAYLLNGLLGVPQEELYRDYLFSNFCTIGQRTISDIEGAYVKTIDEYEGDTLQEKIYNWLHKVAGVTTQELDFIIAYLTGDEDAVSPTVSMDKFFDFEDGFSAGWSGGTMENSTYKLTGNGKGTTYAFDEVYTSGNIVSSVDLEFKNITGNGSDNVFLNMAWCESSVDENPRKGWRFKYDNGNFDLQGHDQQGWAVYDLNLPMDKVYTAISEIDLDNDTYTIRLRYKGSLEDLYSYSGVWTGGLGVLDMWVRIPSEDTNGYILLDNFRINTKINEVELTESADQLIVHGFFDNEDVVGENYKVLLGVYDEDDRLIRVEQTDESVVTSGQNIFEYTTDITEDMYEVKALVWTDGLIPLCSAKAKNIN